MYYSFFAPHHFLEFVECDSHVFVILTSSFFNHFVEFSLTDNCAKSFEGFLQTSRIQRTRIFFVEEGKGVEEQPLSFDHLRVHVGSQKVALRHFVVAILVVFLYRHDQSVVRWHPVLCQHSDKVGRLDQTVVLCVDCHKFLVEHALADVLGPHQIGHLMLHLLHQQILLVELDQALDHLRFHYWHFGQFLLEPLVVQRVFQRYPELWIFIQKFAYQVFSGI